MGYKLTLYILNCYIFWIANIKAQNKAQFQYINFRDMSHSNFQN